MRLMLGVVQVICMIAGPLAVAAWLRHRWRLPWSLWSAGALAFVGSQLVHLPLLWATGPVMPKSLGWQCTIVGLLAGLCEEPARYLVLTRWLKKVSTPEEGIFLGLGHGGVEAVIFGLLVGMGLLGALSIPSDAPAATRVAAAATIDAAPFDRLLAVAERAFAMTFHVAMSLVVLAAARRRRITGLLLAIVLHALFDGLAVAAMKQSGMLAAEGVGLAAALLALFVILFVRADAERARRAAHLVVDHGEAPRRDCAVSTRALTKEFEERVAVDGLTLDVEPGRVVALLGPNGAGKTTTVRMLCALIPPTRGTAQVGGALVVSEAEALRQQVGILTETPGLYERLTAYENLDLFGTLHGLDAATRAARIEQHLRAFDLWERRDDAVSGFSKGMKQKIAIVRALLHEPAVVFLDEPTSGLDPVASREVQDMVLRLKAAGRTILLTTHRLAEAEALADLVAIVKSRLLVLDSVRELKRKTFGQAMQFRFAGGSTTLPEALRDAPRLAEARWHAGALEVPVEDRERDTPELVRLFVEHGLPLVGVAEAPHSLEEIYLGLLGNEPKEQGA